MNDTVPNISAHDGYVLVERQPDESMTVEDADRLLTQLGEFCRRVECRNVLVTGRTIFVQLSTLDLLELGTLIASSRLRIAIVESHNAVRDDVEFLQYVSWNRGGLIRFCDDEEDAMRWLSVDAQP